MRFVPDYTLLPPQHQKAGLVADGFDPSMVMAAAPKAADGTTAIADGVSTITPAALGLFHYQAKDNTYTPITPALYKKMQATGFQF